jgi:hypothetical protein
MSRKVYFQLEEAASRLPLSDTSVDGVDLPEDVSVIGFRKAVWEQVKSVLPSRVIAANLRVYANRAAYNGEEAEPMVIAVKN